MLTIESAAALFQRENPGYWTVQAGSVKRGATSDSLKDVRDHVQQYNDFTAFCELLSDGNYTISVQHTISASTTKLTHPLRIGVEVKRLSGVGDNVQNNGNRGNSDSMMMQMMTLMMTMQSNNHTASLQMMEKQMELGVKLAEAKNQAEIQKIEGNKTVVDKLFKIGEMHLPSIINAVYKVPPVVTANVGRAKSEDGETVPPPSKSVEKKAEEDPKIKEAKVMGLRIQKVLQRIHKLNPTEHPMTTLGDCVSYLEANPAMLVMLLAEQKESNENTKA
jgi:hypothetical protein